MVQFSFGSCSYYPNNINDKSVYFDVTVHDPLLQVSLLSQSAVSADVTAAIWV